MGDDARQFFEECYLELYENARTAQRAEEQALSAVRLAGLGTDAVILDAGCGFGRHALALARGGYRVVGVDRSAALLERARSQSASARWPRWVEGGYEQTPFDDGTFDGVFSLFSSLGYDEAFDRAALREFKRVLRPHGTLVIDVGHRDAYVRSFRPEESPPLAKGGSATTRRTFDVVSGAVTASVRLARPGGPDRWGSYRLRTYTPHELLNMLGDAGFSGVRLHGDLDGSVLGVDTRLVAVARLQDAP
jgi:SAM-dependent methyltransferase